MDVAIIGAGFCGLAVAWHLLNHIPVFPNLNVYLFDSKKLGQGTSGIAAGLLHPFAGAHAKLNWRGKEGMQATKNLLNIASLTLGYSVTAPHPGILRLALTNEQKNDFLICAQHYPQDTQWLDISACQSLATGCVQAPGLWIKEGLSIYSSLYLKGLWKACQQQEAQLTLRSIHSLKELQDFDLTIVTAGAESFQLPELSALTLKSVKGQILEFAWPSHWKPLACALNSQVYILMTEKKTSCLVGATYEKNNLSLEIDSEKAQKELLPKAFEFFPLLQETMVLNCYAGVRAVAPQHRPFMQRLSPSQWILTGMGSKGLLYHALFAEELVQNIWNDFRNDGVS